MLIKASNLRNLQNKNENSKEYTLEKNLLRIRQKKLEVSIYSRLPGNLHEVKNGAFQKLAVLPEA